MKKAEAISILATSVRPREAKDRARYDKAVKMAIEALNCSEFPNNSDTISRQAAIDAMCGVCSDWCDEGVCKKVSAIQKLPSAQPTEASCWGCNCQKMERLKEQKTFSEMVHLHDAERREE